MFPCSNVLSPARQGCGPRTSTGQRLGSLCQMSLFGWIGRQRLGKREGHERSTAIPRTLKGLSPSCLKEVIRVKPSNRLEHRSHFLGRVLPCVEEMSETIRKIDRHQARKFKNSFRGPRRTQNGPDGPQTCRRLCLFASNGAPAIIRGLHTRWANRCARRSVGANRR